MEITAQNRLAGELLISSDQSPGSHKQSRNNPSHRDTATPSEVSVCPLKLVLSFPQSLHPTPERASKRAGETNAVRPTVRESSTARG